jgi:3-dehydroquinate dehydratase-2
MTKIGLLNGPNLDRLGKREPEIYGSESLGEIEKYLSSIANELGRELLTYQSNHEGNLIDKIHEWSDSGVSGLIINPGGFTHTSVALRDAIVASNLLTIEVHLSNIHSREDFRHKSLISGVVLGVIAGMGANGYESALRHLAKI